MKHITSVNVEHLEKAITRIKYYLPANIATDGKAVVDISFIEADPGSGVMTDCLVLKCTLPQSDNAKISLPADSEVSMTVEIYPSSEGQSPRACRAETKILSD
jgi:hypothetical protein